MKKSAEQRLRETNPDLAEYLERLVAPLQAVFQKSKETDPGPDLLERPETPKNLPFYIHQQALERTPAFKQFHEKTGGDLWDLMETPEDELEDGLDPALLGRLYAMVDAMVDAMVNAFQGSAPQSAISVIPPYFHKGRYLNVSIDLSKSKEALRTEFESILSVHHDWVEHPRAPRGEKWPESREEIDQIFHAFDVVEKHAGNYLKATRELYPETNGKYPNQDCEMDRDLQQVKRWHGKVKCIISKL